MIVVTGAAGFIGSNLVDRLLAMEEQILKPNENDAGSRVDVYVGKALDMSRTFARQLVENGEALVDGKLVKPNHRLNGGETVTVSFEAQAEVDAQPEDIPLDIIYEDADIIVVNKARGMIWLALLQ